MFTGSFGKQLLAVWLSAVMAWPAPLWAHGRVSPADATEGVEAILEKIIVNGETIYVAAAGAVDDEVAAVKAIAQQGADAILMVSGEEDPALKIAASTGELEKINVVVAGDLAQAQVPQTLAKQSGFREKLDKKLKSIATHFSKHQGIYFAIFNASAMTSLSIYSSKSAPKAAAVFAVTFAWGAYLLTQEQSWKNILQKAGMGSRWLATKLGGRSLSDQDKRHYELYGRFTASWIPNSIVAATVLFGASALDTSSFSAAAIQAAWFGFLLNYNIWDSVVHDKIDRGVLGKNFLKAYMLSQVLIGTAVEGASYLGLSQAQMLLGGVTISGIAYILAQKTIDETLIPRAQMFTRMLASSTRVKKQKCENLLQTARDTFKKSNYVPAAAGHNFPAWDDVQ